ncbi:hypothetical protein [Chitinophaga qingshengii]|uniref:YD repeat-containing protein n=1 Tax=Chitinophaga qingshengii TaxID=1569794 RepID=A0ABR7TJH3_9BACT|nr:hypothetical protein [Chitinophaga qingshengii]MBC9930620.1 hypothetical protein [Chitinophaga qingshengii]
MKYLKLFVLLLTYVCVRQEGLAQERYKAGKIIPPAPTSAALGAYGEFPIGYFSGTADINIPLYDIKSDKLQLPLKLQYSSTGIKVGESASWVGLGWSLFAGGIITRSVRGFDDWNGEGYYLAAALPPDNPSSSDQPYLSSINQGYRDGEPDMISYNFAGYSGRFSIGKKNDGSLVYMDEPNNLQVEIVLNNGWRITDGNGIRYCFTTKDVAQDYYLGMTSQEISDNAPLSDFTISGKPFVTTAWHLDSIINPGVDTIILSYQLNGSVLSLINKSEKSFDLTEVRAGSTGIPPAHYFTYSANRQVTNEMTLKAISFRQGTVEFSTAPREDLDYVSNKPGRLSDIVVKNRDNRIIKRFQLYQDYFGTGTERRLRLDSIVEIGGGTTGRIPHKFSYFGGTLPPRYSKSIDGWGYFNNANNTFLVPAITVFPNTGSPKFLAGGNRLSNTNDVEMKAGLLFSITYPTGGKTEFDYELNSYSNLHGDEKYVKTRVNEVAQAGSGFTPDRGRINFTIPVTDTPTARISFSHTKVDPDAPDLMNENLQSVYAYLYKGTNVVASYSNWDEDRPYYEEVLLPGSYAIYARYIQGYWTSMYISYEARVPITERKGGGVRIKSIINYEGGKKVAARKFLYTDGGVSSGTQIVTPKFDYSLDLYHTADGGMLPYDVTYTVRESNSIVQGAGGPIVGYSKVTELLGENGENGKTEYRYSASEDAYTHPYIPTMHNALNGKLLSKQVYDAAGKPVSKTTYEYSMNNQTWLRGVKLYTFDPLPTSNQNPALYGVFYRNTSSWFVPSREVNTIYDVNGNQSTTTKTFTYGNIAHKEMTRMETGKSDGRTLITKYMYPDDYPQAGAGSFVGEMKNRHMISPVIEEQTLIADNTTKNLTGGKFTSYKLLSNGSYAPAAVYMLENAAPLADTSASTITGNSLPVLHSAYVPEAYFDNYDMAGNLKDFHKPNNMTGSYLWNYRAGYPIAQIDNANAAEVAYTSFEADADGNWVVPSDARNATGGLTGDKSYNLSNGAISSPGLSAGRAYLLSYWSQNGACSLQGAAVVKTTTGKNIRGYTYYQHLVTIGAAGVVTVSGNNTIDELRLYPADAQMRTYTYIPLTGISSQCDQNNQLLFYEYDNMNRLRLIKDQDGKILKMICYDYYGQPENCSGL